MPAEVLENKRVGERGRNRTINLLIFDQNPKTNGFNGFPSVLVVTNMCRVAGSDGLIKAVEGFIEPACSPILHGKEATVAPINSEHDRSHRHCVIIFAFAI